MTATVIMPLTVSGMLRVEVEIAKEVIADGVEVETAAFALGAARVKTQKSASRNETACTYTSSTDHTRLTTFIFIKELIINKRAEAQSLSTLRPVAYYCTLV